MGNNSKGIIVVAVIVLVVGLYFMFTVVEPTSHKPKDRGTVENYLNETPKILGTTAMIQGSPAPDFEFPTIDNKVIRLSDYIGQKPVVIDFWATWCRPCQMELPALQAFYAVNRDRVEIIAISSEDPSMASAVKETVSSKGLEFPVMHEPSLAVDALYPHEGKIPFLVLIDIEGKVVKTELGYNPDIDIGNIILEEFGLDPLPQ